MMEHLNMQSMDKVAANVAKIRELFPNCVTERINKEGKLEHAIDFDMLKQELSDHVVDGLQERYQFTWPDKRKAILAANAPINKTLRPCREESVDFDNTENLYIEGDNLEVLKLLQETYLGKVKMIYIDPPYNTGNDFVYEDDFKQSADEYIDNSGQLDEEGNRLVANTESNGRFHTDWLNMMYPRLKLAKDLLSDDGVIFISIDDNEVDNLKKICDEIFGESNILANLVWDLGTGTSAGHFTRAHEYILAYSRNKYKLSNFSGGEGIIDDRALKKKSSKNIEYQYTFKAGTKCEAEDGFKLVGEWGDAEKMRLIKGNFICEDGKLKEDVILSACWTQKNQMDSFFAGKETFDSKGQKVIEFYFRNNGKLYCRKQRSIINPPSVLRDIATTKQGTSILKEIFGVDSIFQFSKPVKLLEFFLALCENDSLVLDFFSGSATTAHAVMQLNAEDGGKRKFIMVQLPEVCAENSEAYKAGYKNICEIGKERIRRAGQKIKEENPLTTQDLDIGFRVLKCDSSNMEDVYFTPKEYMDKQQSLFVDNIKKDRSDEDLLFDAMLKLDTPLSSKIEKITIAGKTVYNVAQGHLMACFDKNVTDEVITAIAKEMPSYFVMRDSSQADDSVAINFEQIFNTYSPQTVRRVL
mgnify:FL=1